MSILMFDDPVQYTQRFNSQWPRIFQKSYGKDSILLRLFTKKNCNKQNPYRNKHRGDKDENWKSVELEIMLNFISQLNLAIRLITCYLFIYLHTYSFHFIFVIIFGLIVRVMKGDTSRFWATEKYYPTSLSIRVIGGHLYYYNPSRSRRELSKPL